MANRKPLLPDPYEAARKVQGFDLRKMDSFRKLVRRLVEKKPAKADLDELRGWLSEYPELFCQLCDLEQITRTDLIQRIVPKGLASTALEAHVAAIREGFGYEGAPMLEKLLIENIVVAWLRVQWIESQLTSFIGSSDARISIIEFWERRLSASQRRYLAACQVLAKIRELARRTPALQLNIATQGGQQVNVAGDLVKKVER